MTRRDFYHTGLEISRGQSRTLIDGMGPGDHYYVDYRKGVDGNDGNSWGRALRTLGEAYRRATSNNNDIIFIDGDSEVIEPEMITWSKNRVHVVGWEGPGRLGSGHGARVSLIGDDTPAATSLCGVKVTGVRNTFSNIKFGSACTTTESIYGHIEAGEYTAYNRCSFLKLNDQAVATAADIVSQGDGTSWIECEFGSITTFATVARHVMLVDRITGSQPMKDNNFKDCNWLQFTDNADCHFIHVVAAGDAMNYNMFRGSAFINYNIHAGGTLMTDALHSPAGVTSYFLFDANTTMIGCTNYAQTTDNAGLYICAPVPTAATSGIALQMA